MQRSRGIDCLRAISIFLVLGRHLDLSSCDGPGWLKAILNIWHRGGWTGVDFFFVLSGFLVSGLLFKEHKKYGEISFKNFFIRRGLKIYPSFYLLILISIPVNWYCSGRPGLKVFGVESVFIQNYFQGYWGHTWSLAAEEHFYLLLPLLLIFLLNRSGRAFSRLPFWFASIAIFCLSARLITSWLLPYDWSTNMTPTHLRLDSLFFGVLISYFYNYRPAFFARLKPFRGLLLIGGLVCILPAFLFPIETTFFLYTIGLTWIYLGYGMILLAVLHSTWLDHKFLKPIAFIGAHSYCIYLWHRPIERWGPSVITWWLGNSPGWGLWCIIYLGASLLLGITVSELTEFPVLKLRDRFFPSRSQ